MAKSKNRPFMEVKSTEIDKKKGMKHPENYAHVMVATPAYNGQVDSDYSQSLAEAAQLATVFGIRFTASVMGNGAFIDLARNTFVRFFLEEHTDCTHLFFVDADLKFEPRAFVELIRHCTKDRPVLAGAYRRRQEPEDYPIMWAPLETDDDYEGPDRLWLNDEGWLQCNRVATGFLCIHRSVVEEMAAEADMIHLHNQAPIPKLFYTYIDDEGKFIGEDFAWCDDYVKKYGKKIEVWPDFNFTHGGLKGNYQVWLSRQVKKFDYEQKHPRKKLGDKRRAG